MKQLYGIIILFLLSIEAIGQATAVTGINLAWESSGTWVGGVIPSSNGSVTIPLNSSVTINSTTVSVGNVTINGSLTISNGASSSLKLDGDLVVAGVLTNNGRIEHQGNNKSFNLNGTAVYVHNPLHVSDLDESIFENTAESFSSSSTLIINKWFDLTIGLGDFTRVESSNFGNVTLAVDDTSSWWQQNGNFMDAGVGRIKGTLNVSAGTVCMDDGTGETTELFLKDVNVNGTGNIIFHAIGSGYDPRPFSLVTGNFTDISTSSKPTYLAYNSYSYTYWSATSIIIQHHFYGIRGTGSETGGSLIISVNGALTLGGSGTTIGFVTLADAPFSLSVLTTTTISGSPSSVRFVDSNDGDLTFSTFSLVISGGTSNIFAGAGSVDYTGKVSFTVSQDVIISGTSASPSTTTILQAINNTNKLSLNIGRNFSMSGDSSTFIAASSNGALTIKTTSNFSITGGKFIGQNNSLNSSVDSIITNSNFTFNSSRAYDYFKGSLGQGNVVFQCVGKFSLTNSGTAAGQGFMGIAGGAGDLNFSTGGNYEQTNGKFSGIYNNDVNVLTGSLNFSVTGTYTLSNGLFKCIDNTVSDNVGEVTFSASSLTFTGGKFLGHYSANNANGIAYYSFPGNCSISFSNATDTFSFVGWTKTGTTTNSILLNLEVGGDLSIGGGGGHFISSIAQGMETILLNGNLNFSGGINSFNGYPHKVTLTVAKNLVVTGGETYLSASNDVVTADVYGNITVSGGELVIQAGTTSSTLDVKGSYTQTGGVMWLHKNSSLVSSQAVTFTVNSDDDATGDFTQTGGNITFESLNLTPKQHFLIIKSPNVTLGGAGKISMSGLSSAVMGRIDYAHAGTINFNRTSASHDIAHVQQYIDAGTTLKLFSDIQIASYSAATTSMFIVNSNSVFDMADHSILSNGTYSYSGLTILGRLRTTHPNGLYNNTSNAAINASYNMNYLILPSSGSTVEYYGSANQVVTGIGLGLATGNNQKYYVLDINQNGTPDVNFAYPTNSPSSRSVFVRNQLILTKGELNLDDDHDVISGGRSIIIEKNNGTGIDRVNGYIRSEVQDSTASVIWNVGSNMEGHVIPFGYNSSGYIPFTFTPQSSLSPTDTLIVSTYHTGTDNLPYPHGVTFLRDFSGADNSAKTSDRFWYLEVTGNVALADITFIGTTTELSGIPTPRAQRWVGSAWESPYQGSQSTVTNGTFVSGATSYADNWWTLADATTPLPITLLAFNGHCDGKLVELNWTTLSEVNNSEFEILKSSDNDNYYYIGRVEGAGNSTARLNYIFKDNSSEQSSAFQYYKLRQVDFDGKLTEFPPIAVDACESNDFLVTLMNSTSTQSTFNIIITVEGNLNVFMYSADGKQLTSTSNYFPAGINTLTVSHPPISAGIYLVRIERANEVYTTRLPLGK